MKIITHRGAGTDQGFEERVVTILTLVYDEIKPPKAGIVDVYLFISSDELKLFLEREANSVGVKKGFSEVEFSSYHWAWRGWPCIAICADVSQYKEVSVWTGEIEHESAHSILHGELEYYSFLPPPQFLQVLNALNFKQPQIDLLFYFITICVKDYEVSRLLVKHGFLEHQIQMHLFHLQRSSEEKAIWKELHDRINPQAEILATINDLKILASALPLVEHTPNIREVIYSFLSIVTLRARKILDSLGPYFENLKSDTHINIEIVANRVGEQIQKFM